MDIDKIIGCPLADKSALTVWPRYFVHMHYRALQRLDLHRSSIEIVVLRQRLVTVSGESCQKGYVDCAFAHP
jgi:hypothetical protein